MAELEEAVEPILAGPERKSHALSQHDRQLTAYHEAGHAVVMRCMPQHDPIRKVSILPRGGKIGRTPSLLRPTAHTTRTTLEAHLTSALGGRVAEELVFGETSTRSQDDIATATSIAHEMVERFGMCERLGKVALGYDRPYPLSDETAEIIDDEVTLLIERRTRVLARSC